MDVIASFLGRSGFLPHGYCLTWSPALLWTMVGADAVIAAAYFSIPLGIVSFVRQRRDFSMKGIAWLFSAFIFACGVTHLMGIWTLWQADYGAQAVTMVATAVVSLVTAVALWRLIPRALAIPSVEQLQAAIASLEAEARLRRDAEDRLAEIQQSLALSLASIGAGFIATDREGCVTRMNAVAETVTGWAEAEALGRILWQVLDREGRPSGYEQMNPVDLMHELGTTMDTTHQVVAVARDGTRTALELKATLTRGDDGEVRGLAMVFRDMTRLMQAEAAASRLAAIVESSNDAIIGKTLDGRITSWNAAAEALFGYTADEAIGQPVQMLIPPDREHEEMAILAALAHGARVPAFDTVRRAKDGSLREVSVTISPVRDSAGRIVGASKIARDISEQLRAAAALRDSQARLRFTLDSAQIGDWDLDIATGELRVAPRFDRCFGYLGREVEWSFDELVRHVHVDDRADFVRGFRLAVDQLQDWRMECRVVWSNISVHWISVHGSLRQERGRPTHMLGIITDVTQTRLAAQARQVSQRLEAENRQIQEASRMKSQFLANMSHELRTPLNAIIGFADLLHAGAVPKDSPKHRTYLGHIGTSGRHLLQLINDVLDLSKVESGKFEFIPEPVTLAPLVTEVEGILLTATQRKRIELVSEIDPSLGELVLDPARLKQVLYNYLSNAIKFTPEGGRVTVRALAEGVAAFRIEVEDNGIGIAEADLPRLFVEFQQLDAGLTKQHQGTGLGLALTRRLVQAQGGTVGVRSQPGAGSVFHLVLPRVHLMAGPGEGSHLPGRLLLIEDSLPAQEMAAQCLAGSGFTVDTASTGRQAVERARDRAYDAITLDLVLPDRAGLGVLADIRRSGSSMGSPVVGMSMPSAAGAPAAFAIADVLSKPIRTEEIVAVMARFRLTAPARPTVLVIDDDPAALELMLTALQAIAIDAVGALDGRAALGDLDRCRPDAIILDLMMPGFNGFEVLDALRGLPRWQHVPVFIWTSMVLSDDEYASLALSAHAIVGKGGGELAAMLERLRRWRPRAEAAPAEDPR